MITCQAGKFCSRFGYLFRAAVPIILLVILSSALFPMAADSSQNTGTGQKTPSELLKEIYKEVLEMARYDEDDILESEFHIELDGNEKNKEEHVIVFSHRFEDECRMVVQVTYFEPNRLNSIVKYAKQMKRISCRMKAEEVEIQECDYDEKQVKEILLSILQGVQHKKKLLKSIIGFHPCPDSIRFTSSILAAD